MDGSITPIVSSPGATPGARGPSARAGSSTIGRALERSIAASTAPIRARVPASSSVRTITASGLASRRFRARSRSTAAGEVASTARWNPPKPRTATIAPPARRRAAAEMMSAAGPRCSVPPGPSSQSVGPQAGQLLVSEW